MCHLGSLDDFLVGTTVKNSIYGELGLCQNLSSAMTYIVSNLIFIALLHGKKIILFILQIRRQPERTSSFCRSQPVQAVLGSQSECLTAMGSISGSSCAVGIKPSGPFHDWLTALESVEEAEPSGDDIQLALVE